jgi:hypothetical protein
MINVIESSTDPDWLQQVERWIVGKLGTPPGTVAPLKLVPVRIRAWAAVYRIITPQGAIFIKACGESQRHEPALVAHLAKASPESSLPVLGIDEARGWLLLPDGGQTLAQLGLGTPALFKAWAEVLPRAANLQRKLETDVSSLLAAGVPDKRINTMLARFEAILADPDALAAGAEDGLTLNDIESLRRLSGRLGRAFGSLEALAIPDTLVHEEPHERHIFVTQDGEGRRFTFFDWGDACVGHPFMWAMMPLRDLAEDFPGEASNGQLGPLINAYLKTWENIAPRQTLESALGIAMIASCLTRAEMWLSVTQQYSDLLTESFRSSYPMAIAYWLGQTRNWLERVEEGRFPLP